MLTEVTFPSLHLITFPNDNFGALRLTERAYITRLRSWNNCRKCFARNAGKHIHRDYIWEN